MLDSKYKSNSKYKDNHNFNLNLLDDLIAIIFQYVCTTQKEYETLKSFSKQFDRVSKKHITYKNIIFDLDKHFSLEKLYTSYPCLTKVTREFKECENISLLSKFKHITYLDLTGFSFKNNNLEELQNLNNYKYLNLSYTQITNISVLTQSNNLTYLNLSKTQITDISSLTHNNLTYLNLSNTLITDISSLTKSINLTFLNLSNSLITDISSLANCTQLVNLNLASTQVQNITCLNKCILLTTLNLSKTLVDNITSIASCTRLKTLYLSNTKVQNITCLSKCILLEELYVSYTLVNDFSYLSLLRIIFVDAERLDISSEDSILVKNQLENIKKNSSRLFTYFLK
jgi:Leucine-rich repeat (LRR) protein